MYSYANFWVYAACDDSRNFVFLHCIVLVAFCVMIVSFYFDFFYSYSELLESFC